LYLFVTAIIAVSSLMCSKRAIKKQHRVSGPKVCFVLDRTYLIVMPHF